jgi:hypothetical protein
VAERNAEETSRFRSPISVIRRMLMNRKAGPITIEKTNGMAKSGWDFNKLSQRS